ncbi:hypothetical protein BN2127_JRS4_04281 [Bacillus cereus]|nr:hypothetical protein BN2127_JRS4_04281 [Bacillus cereus]
MLAEVIHSVRYKYPNSEQNRKSLEKIIHELSNEEMKEKAAYEVYKPLNNKNISKAIVAQQLSKKLEGASEELKNKVKDDSYLDYLVKAIYHVTAPVKREGE